MPDSLHDNDPRNWRLEVGEAHLDLYSELLEHPRALTTVETQMMVELVDAWRAVEQRKHVALMHALDDVKRLRAE